MSLLTAREKQDLLHTLGDLSITDSLGGRNLLITYLPDNIQRGITRFDSEIQDLNSIVTMTDGWPQLEDGRWPIIEVIRAAASVIEGTKDAATLRTLADRLEARAVAEAPQMPDPYIRINRDTKKKWPPLLAVISLGVLGAFVLIFLGLVALPELFPKVEATPTPLIGTIIDATPTQPVPEATFTQAPAEAEASITTQPMTGVIKIGIDMPLSGADAAFGVAVLHGATLAVEEVNKTGGILLDGTRYSLELLARDDAINGKQDLYQGQRNASEFTNNPQVLAVVGPYDSGLVTATVPLLNLGGLAHISPADTSSSATTDLSLRPTGKVTYLRVCTTDSVQARLTMEYMSESLNLEKIVILDDTRVYGKGIADNAERHFREIGGTVIAHEGISESMVDFRGLVTLIKSRGVQAVIYGGTVGSNMELISREMARQGGNFPPFVLLGGPGNLESKFISLTGSEAEGSYATLIGVDAERLESAKVFVAAYKARFQAAPGTYSIHGYDATNLIVDAIRRAGKYDRERVRAAIADTTVYQGSLGEIGFDKNGDTTSPSLSIYKVSNHRWVFVDHVQERIP